MAPQMAPQSTTILMLSANPRGTVPLRLDEERREIEAGLLERSRLRDQFQIITKPAVRPRDFQRAMLDHNPQVVHFSGHGVGEQGLALEDETGKVKLVNADALAALFELFADHLHCVVLNACYAEVQAKAIVRHIPYAIGMSDQIRDRAAIEFAVAFYDALGAGRDVEFAYKNACVAIKLAGIPEAHIPILHHNTNLRTVLPQRVPMSSPSHNLTEKQVKILKWFVDEVRADRLQEEIWMSVTFNGVGIAEYEGDVPENISSTMLNALEADGCIVYRQASNAHKVTLTRRAYEIVDATFGNAANSSMPLPSTQNAPSTPPEPMNSAKQQRLERRLAGQQAEWHLKMDRLGKLRADLAIQAGTAVKFQLEQEVQAAEADIAQLEAKLDELEQAIAAAKK